MNLYIISDYIEGALLSALVRVLQSADESRALCQHPRSSKMRGCPIFVSDNRANAVPRLDWHGETCTRGHQGDLTSCPAEVFLSTTTIQPSFHRKCYKPIYTRRRKLFYALFCRRTRSCSTRFVHGRDLPEPRHKPLRCCKRNCKSVTRLMFFRRSSFICHHRLQDYSLSCHLVGRKQNFRGGVLGP